jgi:hypothetical protein
MALFYFCIDHPKKTEKHGYEAFTQAHSLGKNPNHTILTTCIRAASSSETAFSSPLNRS